MMTFVAPAAAASAEREASVWSATADDPQTGINAWTPCLK